MIEADTMAVHLNFLQEAAQPEGDIDARGCLEQIESITAELSVPVIVKETGNGISAETAESLAEAGVDVIDVAGKGGTTWSGVEAHRARTVGADRHAKIGNRFRGWGIPTAVSTALAAEAHPSVVASGGVRSGIDIAKAISLGATAGGMAKPFIGPAGRGPESVIDLVKDIIAELKTAMFVSGAGTVEELREVDHAIVGRTKQILEQF